MGLLSALFPPSLAPAQATEQIRAGELVALDVREPHEFKTGRIANSKNIPAGALPVPPERARPRSALPADLPQRRPLRAGDPHAAQGRL
jgi:rhodanese-related sulfurtransferase